MSRQRRERQQAYFQQRYVAEVMAKTRTAIETGAVPRGRISVINVRHDDGCDLLAGRGLCSCSPDVEDPKLVFHPEDNC